ncbi:MAG TPA: GvpL/GvpF family gas vesicle protein [Natronosporangium sp.]
MAESTGVCVYAVVPDPGDRAGRAGTALAGVRGWASEPVRLVTADGLAAAVGTIPAELAGGDRLQRRLADPGWLAFAVRAHHRVVEACFRAMPTVPFRMGTVYQHEASVRELLTERATQLRAALAVVDGRCEWGVKVYHRAPPEPARQPSTVGAGGADRPGTAYLLQRRAERANREQARVAAALAAARLDAALAALAVAVERPAAAGYPGDAPAPMLRASYLVDAARSDQFTGAVRALAAQHAAVQVRLTGPWPAYSFVGGVEAGVP